MNRRLALLPLAAAALVCSQGARAQAAEPYYIGVRQAFSQETGGRDDTYATTSVRGGLNIPFGRQRVFADASLSRTTFNKNKSANTDGYSLNAGLDWATIERLSGNVRAYATRSLAPFTFVGLEPTAGGAVPVVQTFDNVERVQDISTTARVGVVTRLGIEGSLGHRELAYSATQYAPLEYKQDNGSLGVSYRFSGLLTMGTGVSVQEAKYPRAIGGRDASSRRDVYVSASWVPTGASRVDARMNVGKIEFDRATERDFSGVTGAVSWDWKPTGKLQFVTTLARDAGQDARFIQLRLNNVPQLPQIADFSRVSNSLSLRANYGYSAKIALGAGLNYVRSQVASKVAGDTTENATALLLDATWTPTRALAFGCQAGHTTGTGSQGTSLVSCYGQFTLQ